MKRRWATRALGIVICAAACAIGYEAWAADSAVSLGIFEGHQDVGTVLHPGSAAYAADTKTYTLTGSGENMWFATDDFQFVWKKVSADDVTLTADIALVGEGGDHHRKAALMIRQSLNADAPYADAAVHGDGLTSLQFRDEKGAATHEVESNVSGPKRLRIGKRGDRFYLWTGGDQGDLAFAGGSAKVGLKAPFYVGIGVCAHNKDAVQKAVFTNVDIAIGDAATGKTAVHYSTLETVAVASTDARTNYVSHDKLEGPEWSEAGDFLLFSNGGKRERTMAAGGGEAQAADEQSAPATTLGNGKEGDVRVSPDGKQTLRLTFEKDASGEERDAVLSVVQTDDKSTKTIAKFVGAEGSLGAKPWSPDGKRVTFVSYQSIR